MKYAVSRLKMPHVRDCAISVIGKIVLPDSFCIGICTLNSFLFNLIKILKNGCAKILSDSFFNTFDGDLVIR